jgi:two-component system OmpR family response regulator
LKDINGLDLCRRLRKKLSTPIIILSGSSADADKVLALTLGANNYLTKPISPRVLLSFIEATFNPPSVAKGEVEEKEESIESVFTSLHFSTFSLNLAQHTLTNEAGDILPITPSEFSLLRVFAEHPNRVLSREQLLDFTGGSEIYERTIYRFISRLRKKIEKDHKNPILLKSIYGSGYIFNTKVVKKQSQ